MGMPLQFFVGQVQAEFGKSWLELQETSRYKVLIDLQVGSIAAARKGSWKPLLMLESQGLMPSFGKTREESHQGYADSVTNVSDAELTERLRAALLKREPFAKLHDTITLRDPTPEEMARIESGDFNLKPSVNKWQSVKAEPPLPVQVREVVEIIPEPTVVLKQEGPVIARPAPGVRIMEDAVRAHETSGRVKKEMLESIR
jgi:hypothetical protein